jgi:hypothetical protein
MKQELAMKNQEIYQRDPATRKLVNEGVASVNDEATSQALAVLRYELETFVCDGQYEKGLEHILYTYLKNVDQAQQPAVWVSGFFGSGKSHLVKMLRALWIDSKLEDGATARGIADLPVKIQDYLKELSMQAKKHGGLHAASGTLGAAASGSVRLAVLRIVFKSVGLPEQYPVARFVIWLRTEGIYDKVRNLVEQSGCDWQEELDNFYVAEGLHEALIACKPNLFASAATCVETLNNLYPYVRDISNDEMIKSIKQALSKDGKFPLTLIALDEVQQYIGEDSQRSMDVQETVEACCKNIGGKLLFIGTGQTAVTGTANLKRLEGRFTVRIELSDADVDAVIRSVIIGKKAGAITPIDKVMQTNLGEISRHLTGTSLGHRQDDIQYFPQDYPILPVRRRFWETALRVLDQTGTDSQLRNQLSMVHKAIQGNLDQEIGNVIPADFLFFDSADKLLQSRILPRKVHEKTIVWSKGSINERLMARASALVFLINKIAGSNTEIGIKATVDSIADLMVTDLADGSSDLRSRLPGLLDKCELLMKVGDEYRIQTEESSAWNDEFLSQRSQLANELHRIETERDDRIRKRFGEVVKNLILVHGISKVKRSIHLVFDRQLPPDSEKNLNVWVRDEWAIDEPSVRVDARQAGNQSPTMFVFIPKRNAGNLLHHIMDYKAATATLDRKGEPNTPEGKEARAALETTRQIAEGKIKETLDESFSGTRVFQAGGSEIVGNNLQDMILEAAENALQRLYPQFHVADHPGWEKVHSLAKQGAPDALKAVGYDGEPAKNPVCKLILSFIAGGKKGSEVRNHFEGGGFGWSGDAVDGGLQVLLVAGLVRGHDERGQTVDPKELDRKAVGKLTFKIESATVSASQRIKIRMVLQKMGCQCKQGDELSKVPELLGKLMDLGLRAGGDPPRPLCPDLTPLEEIRLTSGNEQLIAIYTRADELIETIDTWMDLAGKIEPRWDLWLELQELLSHAGNLKEAEEARQQCQALEQQRLLLAEPDPTRPLIKSLEDALRQEINSCYKRYAEEFAKQLSDLGSDSSWQELTEDERKAILEHNDLTKEVEPEVGNRHALVIALKQNPINVWNDRVDSIGQRSARARELAAKALEPKAQIVEVPRRTLKTKADVDSWIGEVKDKLEAAVKEGPVVLR